MRYRLMLMMLTVSTVCSAQNEPPKNADGKYEYAEVVTVDSATATQLMSKAKLYIANAFKSGKDVTQMVDETTFTIVAKGSLQIEEKMMLGASFTYPAYFKLTLQCKDGRYKYAFNDFIVQLIKGKNARDDGEASLEVKPKGWSDKHQQFVLNEIDKQVKAAIVSLKKQMASSAKSEW